MTDRCRIERWIDRLWVAGLLVLVVVSVRSGDVWLAVWTAVWALHGLWRLREPRQDRADPDLPPLDPSYRTLFDPPTRP